MRSGRSLSATLFISATRRLLLRSRTLAAAMPLRLAALAIVGVGADEHPTAPIVGDDLVQIGILGAAQGAGRLKAIGAEWVILEIERHHRRVRRHGVDAFFASCPEQ